MEDGSFIGVFIDPGIKNLAIRISRFYPDTNRIETITQNKMSTYDEYKKIERNPKNVSNTGFDFGVDTAYYTGVCDCLDRLIHLMVLSHYIVIEEQYYENTLLIRLAQHIMAYLSVSLKNKGNRPLIIELSNKLKTRKLGAKGTMSKRETKNFCKEEAPKILRKRGDMVILDKIIGNGKGKLDDHCDVICMDEVWWMHIFPDMIRDGFVNKIVPRKKITFKEDSDEECTKKKVFFEEDSDEECTKKKIFFEDSD